MKNIEHINYIKAPVEVIYQALTLQEGLGSIWTTKLIVKPELGFINEFDFGDNYGTKMKVMELCPNKRILWECTTSDPEWIGTRISFDLTEKDAGVTAVVLKHLDWREITEFFQWCNYNWAMFLLSLKSYCEDGEGLPYQKRKF